MEYFWLTDELNSSTAKHIRNCEVVNSDFVDCSDDQSRSVTANFDRENFSVEISKMAVKCYKRDASLHLT